MFSRKEMTATGSDVKRNLLLPKDLKLLNDPLVAKIDIIPENISSNEFNISNIVNSAFRIMLVCSTFATKK